MNSYKNQMCMPSYSYVYRLYDMCLMLSLLNDSFSKHSIWIFSKMREQTCKTALKHGESILEN